MTTRNRLASARQSSNLADNTELYEMSKADDDFAGLAAIEAETASVAIVGRSDIPEYTPDELTVDGVFAADGGDRTILLQIVVPT